MLKAKRVHTVVRSRESVAQCKFAVASVANRQLADLAQKIFKRNPPVPTLEERERAHELKTIRDEYRAEAVRYARMAKVEPYVLVGTRYKETPETDIIE